MSIRPSTLTMCELDQDRTHNDANEITGITEQADPQQVQWATPVWSARGNMTAAPQPTDLESTYACKYDAWNRLVEVKDGGRTASRSPSNNARSRILRDARKRSHRTSIAAYEYDGLNRRVKKHIDSQAQSEPDGVDTYRHFFYNAGWQILETRKSTTENTAPQDLEPEYQYVWSARYIDAPILRDKNTDEDGLCDDGRMGRIDIHP
ncbi:MAG: hypothetical protein ABIF82_01995, partial [Planctomycetota bacterium]